MIDTVDLSTVEFDPRPILAALASSGAAFVVVGGVAATLHGSPVATADVDAVVDRSEENRQRVAAALEELGAAILVSISVDDQTATVVGAPIDAMTIAELSPARLLTRFGVLDLMWTDGVVGGFEQWAADAVEVEIGDVTLRVASVADLIRSKEHADRDKDRAALPFLRALES